MTEKKDGVGTTAGLLMMLVSGLAISDDEQVKATATTLAELHGVGNYAERVLSHPQQPLRHSAASCHPAKLKWLADHYHHPLLRIAAMKEIVCGVVTNLVASINTRC
jgi:hypothetical protein